MFHAEFFNSFACLSTEPQSDIGHNRGKKMGSVGMGDPETCWLVVPWQCKAHLCTKMAEIISFCVD